MRAMRAAVMVLTSSLMPAAVATPLPNSSCANFSNQWRIQNSSSEKIGEYVEIIQTDCDVVAFNPVELWSPAFGKVVDNVIYIFGINGTLYGKKIHWDDGFGSQWSIVEALPLQDGLTLVRSMLQHAVEVEHAVIQPYLSTLYSIHPGTNTNASSILHDVVVEEMLHMTTAANLLNAVGGHPRLNAADFTPTYPKQLPFVNISLDLAPFTQQQMEKFRLVEEATWGPDMGGKVNTVGVYYFRIGVHLETMVRAYGEQAVFVGDPSLQVTGYSSRGHVRGIYNLSDAIEQLTGVYVQGESAQGALYETSPYNGNMELSHFYRFNEIVHDRCYSAADNTSKPSAAWNNPTGRILGVDYNATYKFKPNPKMSDYIHHPAVYQQMLEFNSCYTSNLADLHSVFNGSPERLGASIGAMVKLGKLAKQMMTTPDPDNAGMFVGPTYEWVNISDSSTPACPTAEFEGMLGQDVTLV